MKTNAVMLIAGLAFASLPQVKAAESLRPFLMDLNRLDRERVLADADEWMSARIVTVLDKKGSSPSGDPHDYVSYGRYWWPDPSSSNGLPFIRRDGHSNREQIALGDRLRWGRMVDSVETLAQAWALNGDEQYASRAGDWVRAWFVTPSTRMNPSLDYAQVRMGHNGNLGSNWGLIDVRDIVGLIDALRLLRGSAALSGSDQDQVNRWLADYLDWLVTSENGKLERAAPNNHGTWYLYQTIAIARHLGLEAQARELAREGFARIENQFGPNGSQPLEIVRADGLSYSIFNLEAQFQVAALAAPLGVDLWHYTAPNGASLRRGLEYLSPFNSAPQTWPHRQAKPLDPGFLQHLVNQAAEIWPGSTNISSRTQSGVSATSAVVSTSSKLSGADVHTYRDGSPEPMRLHVFKPDGWDAGDRRPALVFFFGGGWTRGSPERSASWAQYAARLGMVGVAPDYRTRERFDTSPLESVADGRAAVRWLQEHADELGIDPARLVIGGSSAGGHVALWTAITRTPPGSDPGETPEIKPAAMILFSAVSDTSTLTGYTPRRFGTNALALSPVDQLDARMPPTLAFHGDADNTVPYDQALVLRKKLVAAGNDCELVTVPGGGAWVHQAVP